MRSPQKSLSRRKSAHPQKRPAASHQPPPRRGETSHRPSTQRRSRFHPVARALMALREYQKSINLLIRKALFSLLVREICMKYSRGMCYYWESTALMALQQSAEAFLVWHFADVRVFRPRAKRVTSFVENLQLARRIRGVPYGLE